MHAHPAGDADATALDVVARQLVRLARAGLAGDLGVRVQLNGHTVADPGRVSTRPVTEHSYAFAPSCGQTGRLTVWGEDLDPQALPAHLGEIAALAESYLTVLGRSRSQARVITQLEHAVAHDPLTGAVSRVVLKDRLRHAQAAALRDQQQIGLIYLDLDDFKAFNDRHGHVAGDALLVAVTTRIEQAVRPADTVARLGGDEFLVVCEAVSGPTELGDIAERIERWVARDHQLAFDPELESADRQTCRPTVSVGVTLLAATEDVDLAIRRADAAMYASKRARHDQPRSMAATPTALAAALR